MEHSLSPRFQNAALEHCGFAQRYSAVDVSPDALAATVESLAAEGAGGNVTIPHKEAMFALARHRSPVAEQTGAVNAFWFDDGQLVGHNTDVEGLEAALLTMLPSGLNGRRTALLGAGGSAGAALVALQRLGSGPIRVWSRTPGRAASLARRTGTTVTECASAEATVQDAAVVINATPIGLHGDVVPVDPMLLAPDAVVLDLVYRRGGTAWVGACQRRGLVAQDGLHMLVEQGAAAFSCWFAAEAPRRAMWASLDGLR